MGLYNPFHLHGNSPIGFISTFLVHKYFRDTYTLIINTLVVLYILIQNEKLSLKLVGR